MPRAWYKCIIFKPEEVAGLDVPVDDLLVVEVLEPQHHVTEGQPRGPLLQGILRRNLVNHLERISVRYIYGNPADRKKGPTSPPSRYSKTM